MALVTFNKSVKYKDVRYEANKAFEVDDCDVEELKRVGATVLVVKVDTPPTPPAEPEGEADKGEDVAKLREDLLGYTVPELVQFAEKRGIDLQGKTRKADIYNLIVANLK